MTLDHYEDCILGVRGDILEVLGIKENDAPVIGNDLYPLLIEGKLFLLVPDRSLEA